MTRFIKKKNSTFLIETSPTFTTQFVDTLFPRFLNTFHSTRSRQNFLLDWFQITRANSSLDQHKTKMKKQRNPREKTDTPREEANLYKLPIHLHLKIQNQNGWRIRLKFYHIIREREREKRKQYISNKEFLGKNNRPVLYTGNMRIFYGANRQLLRNIHR